MYIVTTVRLFFPPLVSYRDDMSVFFWGPTMDTAHHFPGCFPTNRNQWLQRDAWWRGIASLLYQPQPAVSCCGPGHTPCVLTSISGGYVSPSTAVNFFFKTESQFRNMLNWEVERTTMEKWILICGLKKQSISPWGKMTLASLDSNDCLPLSSGSSPPNSLSCLTWVWLEISLTDWPPDLEILKSTSAPCWGVSLALSVLRVYFSYEKPPPWLLHGKVWLWPSIFSLSCLGLWNSEPQPYQQTLSWARNACYWLPFLTEWSDLLTTRCEGPSPPL